MSDKLKKGEITLKEVYQITVDYYTKFKSTVNLKALPYILKNIVAKAQGELQYDAEKLEWTGSNKALRIEFIVQTKDKVATKNKATFETKPHDYPVTFFINDISEGLDSTFKWRSGADVMPVFQRAGMSLMERENITQQNYNNKVYLPFFFELEGVLPLYDLLEGHNHTKEPPKKTNPKLIPYFDKLALFCFENGIINLFNNPGILLKMLG
jgi:hypothetical protein